MEILLQPVTSQDEIERLVEINHHAMLEDPLFNWMELYTESSEDEGTRTALTAALKDPSYHIIKAVAVTKDAETTASQQVAGFIHYFQGLIELPKNSNSKGDFQKESSVVDTPQVHDAARAARLKMGDAMYVDTRNHYIRIIQGQRHQFVRRVMVHPDFQRRGIAKKLLQAAVNKADDERIPMWLFSRPAGVPLYQKLGFMEVGQTQLDVPEFKVPASKSMVRWPRIHAEDW